MGILAGALLGAVGVRFSGMEGLADMVSGAFGRGLESLRDPKMSWKDRLAYALNPKSMAIDFATGKAIGAGLRKIGSRFPFTRRDIIDANENFGEMFRRAKDFSYIEPMPKKQLQNSQSIFVKD